MRILLLLSLFAWTAQGVIQEIGPDELAAKMESGFFQLVADVRTLAEFESGHIDNATLVESLASAGTVREVTNAATLAGCEQCNIAVYCRSGARAGRAVSYLQRHGFQSLYNAGGVGDWMRSNRNLVVTGSKELPCSADTTSPSCPDNRRSLEKHQLRGASG